jgi:hypothetical protein
MNLSISRDGGEIGTWTDEQVIAFYKAGQLLPTDYYWHDGMTEWHQLGTFVKPPPPCPPIHSVPTQANIKASTTRRGLLRAASVIGALLGFGIGAALVKSFNQPSASDLTLARQKALAAITKEEIAKAFPIHVVTAPDYDKEEKDWLASTTTEMNQRSKAFMDDRTQLLNLDDRPSSFTSVTDISNRIDLIQNALFKINEAEKYMDNDDSNFVQYLKYGNAPIEVVARLAADYHIKSDNDSIRPFFTTNKRLLNSYLTFYNLLLSNYTFWTVTGGKVIFSHTANDNKLNQEAASDAQAVEAAKRDELDAETVLTARTNHSKS